MTSRQVHPLLFAAAVLLLVVPIVGFAGLHVRSIVLNSLSDIDRTRVARASLDDVLTLQLDEETGLRGFAATRVRLFLEPFTAANERFARATAKLRVDLNEVGLPAFAREVDILSNFNSAWQRSVAAPILAGRGPDSAAIERRGKLIVDRYRATVTGMSNALAVRRDEIRAETLLAVDRVTEFVIAATLLVFLVASAFSVQQWRLAKRLQQQRQAAAEANAAYETEKRISDTLQEAFLLKPMPNVPQLRLSGIYVPATEETRVGGDWYDAVEVGSGRVMFVVGDVAGHGLAAAVAMNHTRQSMLAAALVAHEPAALLRRVNGELFASGARMVTAVCGYADANAYTFTYATAGHPPPILFEPGRGARLLEFGGLPLGVVDSVDYATQTVQTVPGAMLVLYTDGAVEHSRDVVAGEAMLIRAVEQYAPCDFDDPAVNIRDAIFAARSAADDVAIVTIAFAQVVGHRGGQAVGAAVALSAAGPAACPGAVTSIGPRVLSPRVALAERLVS